LRVEKIKKDYKGDYVEKLQNMEIYQTIGNDALFKKKGVLSDGWRLNYTEKNLRISSDRINQLNTGLFDFSRIYYHENTGLYFLAKMEDENIKSSFEAALSLLGDTGIGADRNTGHGLFKFYPETIDIPEPKNKAIALSLVSPNQADLQHLEGAAYDLIKRGGWIAGTSYRKKPIRMFTEGSSFKETLCGQVQNVTPNQEVADMLKYQIYRDGRGFFVGGQNG
jgi:CRISPR-associated protein Csm4